MASGGYHPTKQDKSEPKPRTNWQKSASSDHDDVQSVSSLPGDVRINNWDSSDPHPSNMRGNTKHHKKSKGNPEREREQSLSAESPPQGKKHHTPSSYPRTKMTPSTPTSQRVALENLKQHITFSDGEDDQVNTGGERNNKRKVLQSRRKLHNGSSNRSDPSDDIKGAHETHTNRSSNMHHSRQAEEESESQLPHMEDKLDIYTDDDDDEKDKDDSEKLPQEAAGHVNPFSELKLQQSVEEGQINSSGIHAQEEADRAATVLDGLVIPGSRQELLDILRQKQEQLSAVMGRQQELASKYRETSKKFMEVKAKDNIANSSLAAVTASRKSLENKHPTLQALETALRGAPKGFVADEELPGASRQDRELKSNIIGSLESDDEDNSKIKEVPTNLDTGVYALEEEQQELQNKLLELQNKKHRLDKLLQKLHVLEPQSSERIRSSDTNSQSGNIQLSTAAISNISTSRHQELQNFDDPTLAEMSLNFSLPGNFTSEMNEVSAANLKTVKNVKSSFDQQTKEREHEQDTGAMVPQMYQEMQEKLRSLMEAREQLNHLRSFVQDYQEQIDETEATIEEEDLESNYVGDQAVLHVQPNRETQDHKFTVQQQKQQSRQQQQPEQQKGQKPKSQYQQSHQQNHQIQQQQTKQSQKQQKQSKQQPQQQQRQIQQKKEHLLQLSEQLQEKLSRVSVPVSSTNRAHLLNLAGTDHGDEQSDEDNATACKSESLRSMLESWDNGAEMQAKLRELESAKEKLSQLQNLVALAQQSSQETYREREASVENKAASHATQAGATNTRGCEEELPSQSLRIILRDDEESELNNSRSELEKMRKRRVKLMDVQNQLQHTQNQKSGAQAEGVQKRTEQNSKKAQSGLNQTSNPVVVTFASNDELYSKIRRQRILHEELQSKKKELEDIMKKDINRGQYSCNQDNQSESVSLNSDTFGVPASVDATMATWGSSVVENQETVTEDGDGQDRDDDDDNTTREEDYENEEVVNSSRQQRPKSRDSKYQQDYSHLQQQRPNDEVFMAQDGQWFSAIEGRLSTLTTAVDALLKKSQTKAGQPNASLGQESGSHTVGRLMYPMQEQMLQLQTQSMMLSYGQLVQSFTRQQGDIQHLQQQIQALQLQVQACYHKQSSLSVNSTPGGSHTNFLHPPQSHLAVSTNGYSIQTTAAAVGTNAVIFNHQQMTQSMDRRPADGVNSGIGVGHIVTTGPNTPLPHQGMPAALVYNFPGQATVNRHVRHLQASEEEPSSLTTRDFGQFANTIQSNPTSLGSNYKHQENVYGSRSQQDSVGSFRRANEKADIPLARDYLYLFDSSRNNKRSPSGNTAEGNTLFDNLRDTIYTEVASLISQNESRPYFLLEMFRDLRHIDSDFMRQQILTSMQKFLRAQPDVSMPTSLRYLASEQRPIEMRKLDASSGNEQKLKRPRLDQTGSNFSMDPACDSSLLEMARPCIDMKQLHLQIKHIMVKTIPVVKLRLHDVCSIQLLSYIRHLVLSFIDQMGNQEFVRLFQHQLANTLENTLQKYEGKKMRQCGEDLLMDISDVLYNELAFFRLIQNLDDSSVAGELRTGERPAWDQKDKVDKTKHLEDRHGDISEQAGKTDPREAVQFARFGSNGGSIQEGREQYVRNPVSRAPTIDSSNLSQHIVPSLAWSEIEDTQEDVRKTSRSPRQLTDPPNNTDISQMNDPVNCKNNSSSQELTVDDFSGMSATPPEPELRYKCDEDQRSQPELRCRFEEEQRSLNGLDTILASLGGMEELAGDEMSVLDPDFFTF